MTVDPSPGCAPRSITEPSPREAAQTAVARRGWEIPIPGFGRVNVGPMEQVGFLVGVAALAATAVIEWPVAMALVGGHWLATQQHNKTLAAFGEALELAKPDDE